jgi:hypothetical protein
MAFDAPAGAATDMMYMPAGMQSITPSQGGKSVSVQVMVDASGAAALEAQRASLEARGKRPYFDFNHEDREASFWPTQFYWKADGIYARGTWSDLGEQCITGKRYRQFSPVFFVDNVKARPARIVCREDAKPNMGGLVNDPAFHSILPFWAKDAGATSGSNQPSNITTMTEQEIAALQAKILEQQRELDSLKAKETETKQKKENADLISAEIRAKEFELKANKSDLENAELKAKATALEAADLKRRQEAAKKYAADMVARGALAARDAAGITEVETNMTKQPEVFGPIYAKWAGNPAIAGSVTRSGEALSARRVAIIGEDPQAVFTAVEALIARQNGFRDIHPIEGQLRRAEVARELAALYSREFRGENASRLLDMPLYALHAGNSGADEALSASNSVGTLAGTLVTQRTLELLRFQFPALTRFATDFSDEPASYNQTITSRIISIPTVQTYNTSTGWTDSGDTTTDVSVTINQHKGVPITFDSNTLASTVRRLFDEVAPAAAYALAKNMIDALYGNITAANFTAAAEVSGLADFARANVINMGTDLTLAGAPMGSMNRTLLLYSTYFGKLAQDAGIVNLAAFQKPGIITDGDLPDVHGFKVVDSPNLPAGSDHIVGFGGSKSALVIAARIPNDYTKVLPGASYGNVNVVTNPDLGISVMLTQYVDHKLGSATQRISLMYGTALGQAAAGQLLTSQ